jgi:nitroimidazol reductase NimA-like FMN-containing flavoprotein (pyridoxamine 5'-phosphate oxidase superfamily)
MSVSYMTRQDASGEAWPSPADPGDLSRRLARRRGELRLSTAQVAARAGLSQRYVEYLERYPARAEATVLRRLAAALQTSPAALLGGGAVTPAGGRSAQARDDQAAGWTMRPLQVAECWQLIAPGGIGRIAFSMPSGPVVLPVNYVVASGAIILRTGHGTLTEAHGYDTVAFEVDHIDDALCQGWSVLVAGQAHIVLQPAELRHLRAETDLRPWPEGEHDVWVRIVPAKITGRRIESQLPG